jgi:hypothetical protein
MRTSLTFSSTKPACRAALLFAAALAPSVPAMAQGFGAYVTPPRFEVPVKAGETTRLVLEIQHAGLQTGKYRFYTNDWVLKDDNTVIFTDELAPDSCRPWVAIERRELTIAPNARYRYRFEITPPANSPSRECRFAVMIEGMDLAQVENSNLRVPVSGRIGVIVYASLGGAEPKLKILKSGIATVNGERVAALHVENTGTAHGRLEGFLKGKDATGKEFEIVPEDSPIMPGKTRAIPLRPVNEDGKPLPPIKFPLTVKGNIEWGKNREPLDLRFGP